MKVFLILLSFAVCIVLANAADPDTCYSCRESDIATCDSKQVEFECSNTTFPNVGSGNCYTAAGWYTNNAGSNTTVVLRGCMNCTDMDAAKQKLKTEFRGNGSLTLTIYGNISCCNSPANCNNQSVALPSIPVYVMSTTTTLNGSTVDTATKSPTSHAILLYPVGGILVFATIFIGVFLI